MVVVVVVAAAVMRMISTCSTVYNCSGGGGGSSSNNSNSRSKSSSSSRSSSSSSSSSSSRSSIDNHNYNKTIIIVSKRIEATSIYRRICLIRNGGLGFKHCRTTSSLDPGPWLQLCLRIRTVTMLLSRGEAVSYFPWGRRYRAPYFRSYLSFIWGLFAIS